MIKFIKRLLGLGSAEPTKVEEKPIFVPQLKVVENTAPNSAKTLEATYIPPAKPTPPVAKVRAVSEGITKGGTGSVKPNNQASKKPKAPAKPQSKGKPRAKRK